MSSEFNRLYHGDPQTIFDTLETADLSGHNLGAALSGLARQVVRIESAYQEEITRLESQIELLSTRLDNVFDRGEAMLVMRLPGRR